MNADYIKNIIASYDKLPYKCILIDGPWGVGKSYAIKEELKGNSNACTISMFGINDAQEIYHEALFKFTMRDKIGIQEFVSTAQTVGAALSDKIATFKNIMESIIREKELFLQVVKRFHAFHFIIIDDLERMHNNIRLEEVFGIVDELKKCNYIKIVLIANTKEISQKKFI